MKLILTVAATLAAVMADKTIAYGLGYDSFTSAPAYEPLATGLPIPEPFKQLNYDDAPQIFSFKSLTGLTLSAPSLPNVIIRNTTVGDSAFSVSPVQGVSAIDFVSIKFACAAVNVDSQAVMVPCTLKVKGLFSYGSPESTSYNYKGLRSFAKADKYIQYADIIDFTVTAASLAGVALPAGSPVQLILDSFYYKTVVFE